MLLQDFSVSFRGDHSEGPAPVILRLQGKGKSYKLSNPKGTGGAFYICVPESRSACAGWPMINDIKSRTLRERWDDRIDLRFGPIFLHFQRMIFDQFALDVLPAVAAKGGADIFADLGDKDERARVVDEYHVPMEVLLDRDKKQHKEERLKRRVALWTHVESFCSDQLALIQYSDQIGAIRSRPKSESEHSIAEMARSEVRRAGVVSRQGGVSATLARDLEDIAQLVIASPRKRYERTAQFAPKSIQAAANYLLTFGAWEMHDLSGSEYRDWLKSLSDAGSASDEVREVLNQASHIEGGETLERLKSEVTKKVQRVAEEIAEAMIKAANERPAASVTLLTRLRKQAHAVSEPAAALVSTAIDLPAGYTRTAILHRYEKKLPRKVPPKAIA